MRFLQSMLTTLVSTPLRITRRGIRELNDVGRDAESALDAVMAANGEGIFSLILMRIVLPRSIFIWRQNRRS